MVENISSQMNYKITQYLYQLHIFTGIVKMVLIVKLNCENQKECNNTVLNVFIFQKLVLLQSSLVSINLRKWNLKKSV